MEIESKEQVIIIGSGCAGLTAAIYAARADLKPLVLAGGYQSSSLLPGGQITQTIDVENFPGFKESIEGTFLIDNMMAQAKKFGARIVEEFVTEVKPFKSGGPFYIKTESNKWYETKAVIIATGASAKYLGLKDEEKYLNRGISACATCDGPLPVFRDKHIFVVGGGDSACEEALFLSKFASKVTILVRRDVMRASKIMQRKVKQNEKIEIMWNTHVIGYKGESKLTHLILQTGNETKEVECGGLFIAIGHNPNTKVFKDSGLEMDENGYIITKDNVFTNIEGVFAAGDVCDKIYKQAITAAGLGCMSAISAERWLEMKSI